jgi:hypothetical protein
MQNKPIDLFISHSNKDCAAANIIRKFLTESGFVCWKAPDDIMPGESWPQAIFRALCDSHVMLLVWSSKSISSPEVSKELTLAMRNNITVVPFRLENIKAPAEWEYHLSNTNYFDAFDGDIMNYLEVFSLHLKKIVPFRIPLDISIPQLENSSISKSTINCKVSSCGSAHDNSMLISKKKNFYLALTLVLLFGACGYCYISQGMGVLLMFILGSINILTEWASWSFSLFYIIPLCLLFIFGVEFRGDGLKEKTLKAINKILK